MTTGRVPPSSEEAERAVLGCILLAPERVIDLCVRRGVTEDTFHVQWHRVLYPYILKQQKLEKNSIDVLIISQRLRDAGLLDQIGGNTYLEKLIDATPTQAHAEYYIDIIREKEILRGLIQTSRETIEAAFSADSETTAEEIVSQTQKKFSAFVVKKQTRSLKTTAIELLNKWEKPSYKNTCLSWPWESMNHAIGPLTDEYTIIAAQPSVGKTALALNILAHLSDQGKTTSLLSLESKIDRIAARVLAQRAKVNTFLLRTEDGTVEDFYKARKVAESLDDLKVRVCDEGMNIDQIHAWAHGEKANGSSLLVIDNLRHIRVKASAKKGFEVFSETSLQLKYIRDDTGLPIIALHHLNADDNLAWSADIHRDADIILILSENEQLTINPSYANHNFSRYVVDVHGKKNREGKRGDVKLEFIKRHQYFTEYNPTAASEQQEDEHAGKELFDEQRP